MNLEAISENMSLKELQKQKTIKIFLNAINMGQGQGGTRTQGQRIQKQQPHGDINSVHGFVHLSKDNIHQNPLVLHVLLK